MVPDSQLLLLFLLGGERFCRSPQIVNFVPVTVGKCTYVSTYGMYELVPPALGVNCQVMRENRVSKECARIRLSFDTGKKCAREDCDDGQAPTDGVKNRENAAC